MTVYVQKQNCASIHKPPPAKDTRSSPLNIYRYTNCDWLGARPSPFLDLPRARLPVAIVPPPLRASEPRRLYPNSVNTGGGDRGDWGVSLPLVIECVVPEWLELFADEYLLLEVTVSLMASGPLIKNILCSSRRP